MAEMAAACADASANSAATESASIMYYETKASSKRETASYSKSREYSLAGNDPTRAFKRATAIGIAMNTPGASS